MATDTPTFVRSVAIWLLAVGAAFVLTFFGISFAANRMPTDIAPPGISSGVATDLGHPAPDFRLASFDGGMLGPPDYAGDVVVIDLWASWCGPCRVQAQFLDQLHAEYKNKDVHFLAINSEEDETVVRAYVQKTPFPYPVLLDPRGEVKNRYRSNGLPTVMVIDRAGRVTFLQIGVAEVATLRSEIEKALAVSPDAAAQPTA